MRHPNTPTKEEIIRNAAIRKLERMYGKDLTDSIKKAELQKGEPIAQPLKNCYAILEIGQKNSDTSFEDFLKELEAKGHATWCSYNAEDKNLTHRLTYLGAKVELRLITIFEPKSLPVSSNQ